MVWLHFGAYQFGGASVALYDGEQLAAPASSSSPVGPDGREQRLAFWDAYFHRRRATA